MKKTQKEKGPEEVVNLEQAESIIQAAIDEMAAGLANSCCANDKLLAHAVLALQLLYTVDPKRAVSRMTATTAYILTQRALAIRAKRRGEKEVVA